MFYTYLKVGKKSTFDPISWLDSVLKSMWHEDQAGMFKTSFQSDIPTKTQYENIFEV
jgi:hypothetical protein